MSKLSGIRDVDREILNKLDDKSLLKACSFDKYTWNTVCDDAFLRRRLLAKYPKIEQYKFENETWKHFFLRAVRYIALMKEKYCYEYAFGNFAIQYKLFRELYDEIISYDDLLYISSAKGELVLVIWSLKNGAVIRDKDLKSASRNGNLDIVKYLVEHGANIHADDDYALRIACSNGHLEVVKYLVEAGADIHAKNDGALRWAILNGHSEVVKFLVEKGADINTVNVLALE